LFRLRLRLYCRFSGQLLEGVIDEGAEVPGIHIDKGLFTGGVVAAGECLGVKVDQAELVAQALKIMDGLEGELAGEGEVVVGVDDANGLAGPVGARGCEGQVAIGARTDGGHEGAKLLLAKAGLLKGGADVAGALTAPDNIAKPGSGVIEGIDAEAGLMRAGNESVAGTEAGAEHAKLLVALLLEPVKATANIDHGLAVGGDGAADVGADGIV